jgi:hypothetical protein
LISGAKKKFVPAGDEIFAACIYHMPSCKSTGDTEVWSISKPQRSHESERP